MTTFNNYHINSTIGDGPRTDAFRDCTSMVENEGFKLSGFDFFTTTFYTIVFTIGVLANAIVLFMVLCCVHLRIVSNIYVLNLALADLLFVACIPFVIARTYVGNWIWGVELCKLYFTGITVNPFASVAFLTALSVDRYLAICHPVKSRRYRRVWFAVAISGGCWIVVCCSMIPVYAYASTVLIIHDYVPSSASGLVPDYHLNNASSSGELPEYEDSTRYEIQCVILWPTDHRMLSRRTFTFFSAIFSYFLPLLIVWSLYGKVLLKLKQKRRCRSQALFRPSQKCKYRKATWMVLSVVIAYTVCWMPFWIVQFVIEFLDEATLTEYAFIVKTVSLAAYCLQYTNSLLNPVLYGLVSGTFTDVFYAVFRTRKGRLWRQRKIEQMAIRSKPGTTGTSRRPTPIGQEPLQTFVIKQRSSLEDPTRFSDPWTRNRSFKRGYHEEVLIATSNTSTSTRTNDDLGGVVFCKESDVFL